MRPKKTLVLGPRYHKSGENGGVVVLFELFLEELRGRGHELSVIDLNRFNYRSYLTSALALILGLLRDLPRSEAVSLHGTANDITFVAPVAIFMSRLLRKPIVLRKFAGNFDTIYSQSRPLTQSLIRYALRNASAVFFETKYLVRYFSQFNSETYWFPNVRKRPDVQRSPRPYERRFVFVGKVSLEKGIAELARAADALGPEYVVDVYGPIDSELVSLLSESEANYRGMLESKSVPAVLSSYDVLVLPTFWAGEGYPGVIIEAFSVGLPVIATQLKGIQEIVEDGKDGILVPPKNVDELTRAIVSFTDQNYPRFSENACRSFDPFDSNIATSHFLETINGLR